MLKVKNEICTSSKKGNYSFIHSSSTTQAKAVHIENAEAKFCAAAIINREAVSKVKMVADWASRIPACRLAGISESDIKCVGILKQVQHDGINYF